jgi:hypothetical protein
MIVACLALFVVSTGTSIAASHYLITSTKQIKPSVIKALKGAKGPRGATGAQGAQGLKGDTGATGAQGAQGLKGDTGATGAQGAQGLEGDTGATGAQGAQGLEGDTGATGAQGAQGLKGDTGAAGHNGATQVAVYSAVSTLAASSTNGATAEVSCPAGTVATGGGAGYNASGSGYLPRVALSVPLPVGTSPPTGWRAIVYDEGNTGNLHATVSVICASP